MKSSHKVWWIVAAVIGLMLFGDEILGAIGAVLGTIIGIGVTGLVTIAVAVAAFALVIMIGGSIAIALMVAAGALVFALFSWLWPFILLAAIIYVMVRKRPKPV
ncbi:hypothetical protein CWE22_11400 [Pseudidiomarina aestuarii]|uniref:Uncharacterized protein n=1 Tax=Pseudidiomarina aestuarii TaxID=624146 RepID=A0A7Z6ZRH2_9GAMM|nr:hypothetical protein [Pseudidiomarina aestuarii]RUO38019.1 hypothetical protein CWE22_11400 [Pseudidiomarina aestuarii]